MRTRNILIIIAGVCALLLLVVGLTIWLFYSMLTGRMFGYEPPPTPPSTRKFWPMSVCRSRCCRLRI